jgi:hypothetical protein
MWDHLLVGAIPCPEDEDRGSRAVAIVLPKSAAAWCCASYPERKAQNQLTILADLILLGPRLQLSSHGKALIVSYIVIL